MSGRPRARTIGGRIGPGDEIRRRIRPPIPEGLQPVVQSGRAGGRVELVAFDRETITLRNTGEQHGWYIVVFAADEHLQTLVQVRNLFARVFNR